MFDESMELSVVLGTVVNWASTRVSGCDAKFLQSFDGLQVWGYGEEMTSHSLDTYQLPSIRLQTQGHRYVVMLALDKSRIT